MSVGHGENGFKSVCGGLFGVFCCFCFCEIAFLKSESFQVTSTGNIKTKTETLNLLILDHYKTKVLKFSSA